MRLKIRKGLIIGILCLLLVKVRGALPMMNYKSESDALASRAFDPEAYDAEQRAYAAALGQEWDAANPQEAAERDADWDAIEREIKREL